MTEINATFGPADWTPVGGHRQPRAWTKTLLRSEHGHSFVLVRMGRTAEIDDPVTTLRLSEAAEARVLVLDGELTILGDGDRQPPVSFLRGDFVTLAVQATEIRSGFGGCLALILTGERLGDPAQDVFSPDGWLPSGPGQWFQLLLESHSTRSSTNGSPGCRTLLPGHRHPGTHRTPHTAHRFLFLDGEADDELAFPDGTRQTAHRAVGDFVDYPYPIEHQTFSRSGCMILFLHEPPSAGQT